MTRTSILYTLFLLLPLFAFAGEPPVVSVRVYLEGAYAGKKQMSTHLSVGGEKSMLHKAASEGQFYVPSSLSGFYNRGSLQGTLPPANAVDLVFVAFCTTNSFEKPALVLPAWLLGDGALASFSTGKQELSLAGLADGNYYVYLFHRNHLPAKLSAPVYLAADAKAMLDFADCKLAGGATVPADGVCLLPAGEVDGGKDACEINAIDAFALSGEIYKKKSGYIAADLNLDGRADERDLDLINRNQGHLFTVKLVP